MSRFKIVTADERLSAPRGIKGVVHGQSGIGKTSLLWTLPAESTLFLNLEAGELAVQGWDGREIRARDWPTARDLICWIGGPNTAMRDDQIYSPSHYAAVCKEAGGTFDEITPGIETVFIDSITVASRLCLQWAKGQPEAFSEKTGKPDVRGAYGLLGQQMIGWLTHAQHTPAKNVWLVGLLDKKQDEFNRPFYALQIEGSKTGLELPGIVDEVIAMTEMRTEDGTPYRAFICHTLNPLGVPAKDRSGRLDAQEEPHLGKLMEKIRGPVKPVAARLNYQTPTENAA
jgi:hypothetical protein